MALLPSPPDRRRPPQRRIYVDLRSRDLVPADTATIRRKAIRDAQRARRTLEQAQEEWKQFESEDQPAFEAWYNGGFGAFLTRVREMAAEVLKRRMWLSEMEEEVWATGCTPAQAYEWVVEGHSRPEELTSGGKSDSDTESDTQDHGWDESDEDEDEDEWQSGWSSFEDYEERIRESLNRQAKEERGHVSGRQSSFKDLYRRLARVLHPDLNGQAADDPRLRELWLLLQEAREEGDLEKLNLVAALLDLESGFTSSETTVGQILEVRDRYRRSTRVLRSEIRRVRPSPAWGFTRRPESEKQELRRTIAHRLEEQIAQLRSELDRLDEILGRWSESG